MIFTLPVIILGGTQDMKITDIIKQDRLSLSFEVFPPKTDDKFEKVKFAIEEIADRKPSFMSVTYGAGGGTSKYTVDIARDIREKGVTSIAHLTCVSSSRQQVRGMLDKLRENGIKNILALRGDIPEGLDRSRMEYRYASELVTEIKEYGGFCIGGACYPETHPESSSSMEDIANIRKKVDAGVEFLTTQMFFDNDIYYNFLYRLREAGVDVPVIAGIMPITSAKQIERVVSISQNALPQRFLRIVDRFRDNPKAMKQAGIAYATEQIVDLYANGVKAVHIYSMNNPSVVEALQNNVSEIIG